jgi:hypothetical protein
MAIYSNPISSATTLDALRRELMPRLLFDIAPTIVIAISLIVIVTL